MFEKYNIKTTWFVSESSSSSSTSLAATVSPSVLQHRRLTKNQIPGHSLETFPEECRMIAEAGHEIGLHGYSHENPTDMSLEQQTAVMDKCYKLIKDFTGRAPRGIVAPWWESSKEGVELMLKYGLEYDHSFSHQDCQVCASWRFESSWSS